MPGIPPRRPANLAPGTRRHLASLSVVALFAGLLAPMALASTAAPASAQTLPTGGLGGLLGSGGGLSGILGGLLGGSGGLLGGTGGLLGGSGGLLGGTGGGLLGGGLLGSSQEVTSVTAAPAQALAGSSVELTANVSPSLLALLGSIPVNFTVISGPNAGATIPGCTVTYVVEALDIPIGGNNFCSTTYADPTLASGQDIIAATATGQTTGALTTVTWLGVAGAIVMTPEFAFDNVNVPATVTATVVDVNGSPVSGAQVTFAASGTGGETPPSGSATTDVSGNAPFTFSSATFGTSTVTAATTRPGGAAITGQATVFWADPPASVALTQQNYEGLAEVGASDTVSAAVRDAHGVPVSDNTPVTFTVTGAGAVTGTSGTSGGTAVFSFSSNVTGTSTIVATTTGVDGAVVTSSPVTATWQSPVATSITISPRISALIVGNTQTLIAGVVDQFGNPVDGAVVRFFVQGVNPTVNTSSGQTDATGRIAFQERGTNVGLDQVTGYVDLNGDDVLDSGDPSATADILWEKQPGQGYWLAAADGGIFAFGPSANFEGSTGSIHLNKQIVGMAATPSDFGYWEVASDGGIFAFGDAKFYGSTGSIHLNQPIVGMAATPDGGGYWLVASDGGIFAFGDARFYGSTGSIHLNKPIVAMASTPDGGGYWLVASDGGIFAFGDARFFGSTGSIHLNQPIVGFAASPDGGGYLMTASDGGIFAFGDDPFYGSTGSIHLNKPIVAMGAMPDGSGYYLVASDGGVFNFGPGAKLWGSAAGAPLNSPIVAMTVAP